MVRTSTARKHEGKCPACNDPLTEDKKGLGFVRHTSNPNCGFEKGERDGDYEETAAVSDSPRALVEIGGYSERGIVNSIFYDVASTSNPLDVLKEFLNQINFTDKEKELFSSISGIKIIIEHSLSDFGDPDVILLLHGCAENINSDWKSAIFIEAKVKTAQGRDWTLINERDSISNCGITRSSNLFTQLHRKVLFSCNLRKQNGIAILNQGVPTINSKKSPRRIGKNPVVVDFIEKMKPYVDDVENVFFVAIVPDSSHNINDLFNNIIKDNELMQNHFGMDWNAEKWRFVTWQNVEQFCLKQNFINTIKVFNWNKNQIY